MNDFMANYLKKIIPVPFGLSMNGELTLVGEKEPEFTVLVNNPISYKDLMTSTSLALGEAYMRGDIEVDRDLYMVLNTFLGEMGKFTRDHSKLKKLIETSLSKTNQKKEVTSHYDIGNEFYELWLDETMSYSCAYFKKDTDTLYEAQIQKIDHTLEKLMLEPGMTLLDIGCGWGYLLKRAVEKYDIKGVGITLSQEQYKKFSTEIKEKDLENHLQVMLMDYRDLSELDCKFDRVVSIGMLEHVGRDNYSLYLDRVKSILKPQGLFLLHYISSQKEHPGDAFMKKYIFPGGVVPSLREIIHLMGDKNLYTLDVESLRRHYNKTLLCWRSNFLNHRNEIESAYGKEFTRMWDVYLSSCAATFNNGIIDVHQILMSNGVNNMLPMNRVV